MECSEIKKIIPNNACETNLTNIPHLIKILQSPLTHKNQYPNPFHYKAHQCQKKISKKDLLSQFLGLILMKLNEQKYIYQSYWTEVNSLQALNRQYTMAECLDIVTDHKLRKTYTDRVQMYR